MASRLNCLARAFSRALLVPPIFLVIVLCLWTLSAVLPFSMLHICVSGRRMGVQCFPKGAQDSAASNRMPEMLIHPQSLNLEDSEAHDIPTKPLRDVKSVGEQREVGDMTEENKQGVRQDEDGSVLAEELGSPLDGVSEEKITKTEEEVAAEEVMKLMEDLRKSAAPQNASELVEDRPVRRGRNPSCEGRKVYIYDLPSKFNTDLLEKCDQLVPWFNMCDYFSNSGLGKVIEEQEGDVLIPARHWYETHQYSLEIIFHERLKVYPCLTKSPEEANLFYIPYYGGLDVLRWHFLNNVSNFQRDQLGLELVSWLNEQPSWARNDGVDHVLVLGKISWDFRRFRDTDLWGSNLLVLPQMQQLTKLLIERHPWHTNDVGVPHPTFFHPRTDADFRVWQGHIDSAERRNLVSFAGLPRPNQTESIRTLLIEQCTGRSDSCYFLECRNDVCLQPNTTMNLFLNSEFCLQPPGDSPTRRSIFDSLIAGCIPVLFDPYSAYYQYPWHLPGDGSLYSVYISSEEVREGRAKVVEVLEKIPKAAREEMRARIIYEIMPGLVYAKPGARLREVEDAFQISLRSLFWRVANRLAISQGSSAWEGLT